MLITDVAWVRDDQRRPVLELRLDGHPAHFASRQSAALLDRGLVRGLDVLVSQRLAQLPNRFLQGDGASGRMDLELVGCTDDPQVFALFAEMCRAVLAGTWQPGPRPLPV